VWPLELLRGEDHMLRLAIAQSAKVLVLAAKSRGLSAWCSGRSAQAFDLSTRDSGFGARAGPAIYLSLNGRVPLRTGP
jgi:hypothetical protein